MTITVTEHNEGEQISAQAGDSIEVHLAENATAGYRWETDGLDPQMFELQDATGNYQSGAIGSGGEARFRVKVRAPGAGTIRFKYWRRWEGEGGVLKRFEFKINAS